jgi:uncharacterized coiled-coil DUF342 family protein
MSSVLLEIVDALEGVKAQCDELVQKISAWDVKTKEIEAEVRRLVAEAPNKLDQDLIESIASAQKALKEMLEALTAASSEAAAVASEF